MRVSNALTFIAVWVEDGMARLWSVEMASGATDEIARFTIEGLTRPQVLEIARQFARARRPGRNIIDELTMPADEEEPAKRPMGRPRKHPVGHRPRAPYDPDGRNKQIARQTELYEALVSFGEEGATSQQLAEKLGRTVVACAVPCGSLVRAGKAVRVDEKWYALANEDNPPPPRTK